VDIEAGPVETAKRNDTPKRRLVARDRGEKAAGERTGQPSAFLRHVDGVGGAV